MHDDLPPDLERLLTLRTWHALWLERIDKAIVVARAREAEEERRRAERERAVVPDFVVEPHKVRPGLHVGGCEAAPEGSLPVDRRMALMALQDGVTPCLKCRPDSALGVLE